MEFVAAGIAPAVRAGPRALVADGAAMVDGAVARDRA